MDYLGKLAVASTYSPRFLPMLAQAKGFSALLERPFTIIHAGEANAENQERFHDAFNTVKISVPIHWCEADTPSNAIIDAVKRLGVGLVLAGAMERNSEGRYFLGKVSRALVREAPCSLLLFVNPTEQPVTLRTIAAIVDYTDASRNALRVAIDLAARSGAEALHVLRVFTVFAQVLAEPHQFIQGRDVTALAAEEARLESFVEEFETGDVPVQTRCIEGTTGFAAADFVQSIEADLLVVGSHPAAEAGACEPHPHPQFPARMEWLENVIPSNLLIVRVTPGLSK